MKHADRDAEMCRRFGAGETLRSIANHYGLSHERVRKILQIRGVLTKRARAKAETFRDEFLGVNLTEEQKIGLRLEAERRGLSMSALTADLIEEMLSKPVQKMEGIAK